ncbi:MAG TPA: hypothetical protein VFU36_04705 [Jatrophihabitans sp.]|nr:hypothetical protein [Jatrophihabitans sp.]
MGIGKGLLVGAAAGAAGTTALNAVTYLDMAIRGRAASSAPETAVQTIGGKLGLEVPGDPDTRQHRTTGLGALLGIATGVGVGGVLGVARAAGWRLSLGRTAVLVGLAAMLGSDTPMVLLGISDAREWSVADWLSDLAPHLAYGLASAATAQALDR